MQVPVSYIFSNSIYALVDLIRCKCCGAKVVQLGKVHFGCDGVKSKSCNNRLRISWGEVKAIILSDLKEQFLAAKDIDGLTLRNLKECESISSSSYYVVHTSIQTVALLDESDFQRN